MKRCLVLSLAFMLLLSAFSACASAEGHISVTDQAFLELEQLGTVYFYARLENDGDAPVSPNYGILKGYTENGDPVIDDSYIFALFGQKPLEPGESTYVKAVFRDVYEDITDYEFTMLSVSGDVGTQNIEEIIPTETDLGLDVIVDSTKRTARSYVEVVVTNDTDEIWDRTYVVAALYDEDNNLLCIADYYFSNIEIYPNTAVKLKVQISPNFINYFNAQNATISRSEVSVYQCPEYRYYWGY